MTDQPFPTPDFTGSLEGEEQLVCEALVRELGRAKRWSAVLEGFTALTHVRHMAAAMHNEAQKFAEARGEGPAP